MNILFISYWGIHEGLTRSTVLPHVKILGSFVEVDKIYLITMERRGLVEHEKIHHKIKHIPYYSKPYYIPFIDKILDFIRIPDFLAKIAKEEKIHKIIARGSPAGAIAYLLWKKIHVPYYVESFEPHADYMTQTGTWQKWSVRNFLQNRWEKKQYFSSSGIMTVTDNYKKILESKGINPDKIISVPCSVDPNQFKFDKDKRERIRTELQIENRITGIYVGKFGGMYLQDEAFKVFTALFKYFVNFYLIILTSEPKQVLEKKLKNSGIYDTQYHINNVSHTKVPEYLSAADFGLALYKSFPANRFLSPIKVGEYWANGLPVLMTEGVGDESIWMEKEGGGTQFQLSDLTPAIEKIEKMIGRQGYRTGIRQMAEKYRSFDRVSNAYKKLIINT